MKRIPLTQGKEAWVDDGDYAYLMQWKWHASKTGKTFYAMRYTPMCHGVRQHLLMHIDIALQHGLVAPEIDHCDRNGLHNWMLNLRAATTAANAANRGMLVTNTSGAKGVSWFASRQRWCARVRVCTGDRNRMVDCSRMFDSFDDAVVWRDAQARILHGQYAFLNVITA